MSLFSRIPSDPPQLALYYSNNGVHVFPCQPGSKKPFTFDKLGFLHGFKDATTDQGAITGAWTVAPGAMVGIPTGQKSGYWVLDIDVKHGDPDDALAELEAHYGAFNTMAVRTPSGGLHIYFQCAPGTEALGIFEGEALPNGVIVDLRANGGYAIAPGSRSQKGTYAVCIDREVTAAPAQLVADMAAICRNASAFRVVGGTSSLQYQRTVRDLAEQIRNNKDWHKSQRELIAKWTSSYGIPPEEWVKLAPLFQQQGYSLEQTIQQIHSSAAGAFNKFAPKAEPIKSELEFVPLSGLQSRDPPEWQIAGVIPEKTFGYIYGPSASFKTFVALDMALSMAYGRHWQGRPTKRARVLYILGEGQGAFANRVRSWRHARGLEAEDADLFTLFQPIQFMNTQDVARLVQAIKDTGLAPDWIFLDTVQRNFGPGDPDKTQDMTLFVAAIDAVRAEFGCGVFAVHHAGKDLSKGARNSSVLFASADWEMRTEREETSPSFTLVSTKAKDWDEFGRLRLITQPVAVIDPRTGEEVTSLVVSDQPDTEQAFAPKPPQGAAQEAVMAILTAGGSLKFGEILTRTTLHKGTIWNALTKLQAKNSVIKDNESGCYYIPKGNQDDSW